MAYLFEPIRTRRTFEEAVHQVCEAIASQRLRVGDRLPSERALAEQMGVGRPTIRDALKSLASLGLIEFVGSGRSAGAIVTSDIVPVLPLESSPDLRNSEVGEVLVARRVLEPSVAQLAAVQRSDEDVDRLLEIVERQRAATSDRAKFIDLDLRFHIQLGRSTKNTTISGLVRTLYSKVERAYDFAMRDPSEDTALVAIEQHTAIVRAVAARDPDLAEAELLAHLRLLEALWEDESGIAFQRKIPGFLTP